jgi:hypothetical protein
MSLSVLPLNLTEQAASVTESDDGNLLFFNVLVEARSGIGCSVSDFARPWFISCQFKSVFAVTAAWFLAAGNLKPIRSFSRFSISPGHPSSETHSVSAQKF